MSMYMPAPYMPPPILVTFLRQLTDEEEQQVQAALINWKDGEDLPSALRSHYRAANIELRTAVNDGSPDGLRDAWLPLYWDVYRNPIEAGEADFYGPRHDPRTRGFSVDKFAEVRRQAAVGDSPEAQHQRLVNARDAEHWYQHKRSLGLVAARLEPWGAPLYRGGNMMRSSMPGVPIPRVPNMQGQLSQGPGGHVFPMPPNQPFHGQPMFAHGMHPGHPIPSGAQAYGTQQPGFSSPMSMGNPQGPPQGYPAGSGFNNMQQYAPPIPSRGPTGFRNTPQRHDPNHQLNRDAYASAMEMMGIRQYQPYMDPNPDAPLLHYGSHRHGVPLQTPAAAPLENAVAPGHHAGDQMDINFPDNFAGVDAEPGWTFEPVDYSQVEARMPTSSIIGAEATPMSSNMGAEVLGFDPFALTTERQASTNREAAQRTPTATHGHHPSAASEQLEQSWQELRLSPDEEKLIASGELNTFFDSLTPMELGEDFQADLARMDLSFFESSTLT
ncbi:MAG: hypothetical protein Q9168_004990 [Polycauliona sp. 1 TL-2023]